MRLFDIDVKEVSLVDKAANKRRYAFWKRDDKAAEAVKEEVAEATKILKAEEKIDEVKPEPAGPTPEEQKEFEALLTELNALTAELHK